VKRIAYAHTETIHNFIKHYENLYSKNPRSRIFAPLADAYRKQGRIDEAIKLCLIGLKYHPNYSSGRLVLGKSFFDKRLFDRAASELNSVIKANPQNVMAFMYLGKTYLALQDYERALVTLVKAKNLSPGLPKLDKIIERLEIKTKLVYRDENEFSQYSLKELAKRPLFNEDQDQYVLRPVKDIFGMVTPGKKIQSLSPTTSQMHVKKSLENLFVSQGMEEKADEAFKGQSGFRAIELPFQYETVDKDSVLSNVIKKAGPTLRRKLQINPVLEDVNAKLPNAISEKHLNDALVPGDQIPESSAWIEEGATDVKNFDGVAPEKFSSKSAEKSTIMPKKISLTKLNALLTRIQERAY
jgi:tetratricopeptide (TPR) repeat protein